MSHPIGRRESKALYQRQHYAYEQIIYNLNGIQAPPKGYELPVVRGPTTSSE